MLLLDVDVPEEVCFPLLVAFEIPRVRDSESFLSQSFLNLVLPSVLIIYTNIN